MSEHQTTTESAPVKAKNAVLGYFEESFQELKKVTWPTRNRAIRLTLIVIGFCIVFAAAIGVLDFGFNQGYRWVVNYAQTIAPVAPISAPVQTQTTVNPSTQPAVQITPGPAEPAQPDAPTPTPPNS